MIYNQIEFDDGNKKLSRSNKATKQRYEEGTVRLTRLLHGI